MEEEADEAQEQGQGAPIPRAIPPSQNQAGDYNKITNYLILYIRKTYKNGGDIANAIENQEPFNFNSSAPKLKMLTTVMTTDTAPTEKLEIKCENNQYRIKYKAELQLQLKQKILSHQSGESICILIWAMHNRPTA